MCKGVSGARVLGEKWASCSVLITKEKKPDLALTSG